MQLTCPTMVLARISALRGPLRISAAFRKIWARSDTGFRSHSFRAAKEASMALLSRVWRERTSLGTRQGGPPAQGDPCFPWLSVTSLP